MDLQAEIRKIPDWKTKKIGEIAAVLKSLTTRTYGIRHVNIGNIGEMLGKEAAAIVLYSLQQAIDGTKGSPASSLLQGFFYKLSASTVDFANDDVRTDIRTLGASWPSGLCDAILALGYIDTPVDPVDEADISAAIDAMVQADRQEELAPIKRQLEDAGSDALQQFREALTSWNGEGKPPTLVFAEAS